MRRRASMSFKDFIKIYKWHVVIWIIGLIVLGNFVYKKVWKSAGRCAILILQYYVN